MSLSFNVLDVPQRGGLFRASLVLEYDDGTVHSLRVEKPYDVHAQVNKSVPEPDVFLDDPAYLPMLAGAMELVVRMKAGGSPVVYRHD